MLVNKKVPKEVSPLKSLLKILSRLFVVLLLVIMGTTSVSAQSPSMKFSPEKVDVVAGEKFVVDIVVNTAGEEIGGAGAKITYDPKKVGIVSITPGTIFSDYPTASFDNYQGKATLSGIVSSINILYKGTGVFGSIQFQAIAGGGTSVKFDHTPGNTTDSNLAVTYDPGDILSEVNTLTITVSGSTTPLPTSALDIPGTSEPQTTVVKENGLWGKILDFLGIENEDSNPTVTGSEPFDIDSDQARFGGSSILKSLLLLTALVLLLAVGFLFYRGRRKSPNKPVQNL